MEVSGQKLWLDEAMTHSTGFLKTLVNKENSRDLTSAEKNMKHIVASYCYSVSYTHLTLPTTPYV